MTRILDFNGRDAERTVTVASIVALKGSGRQYVQVTAGSEEEAAAAEAAEIDMVVCLAGAVPEVRRGSSRLFVTAAIDFGGEVMFLFQSDVVGESSRVPRHARSYGDVADLQRRIRQERVQALAAFRADVLDGRFPADSEVSRIDPHELARFVEGLGRSTTERPSSTDS